MEIGVGPAWYGRLAFCLVSLAVSLSLAHAQVQPRPANDGRAMEMLLEGKRLAKRENDLLNYLRLVELEEFKFLQKACKLSAEQAKPFRGLGEPFSLQAIKTPQANSDRMGMGEFDAMNIQINGDAYQVSHKTVAGFRHQLREKYKELLTAEQKATFEMELDAKIEFSRQATAECLLLVIDDRLALSHEQRQPLLESLKSWEEGENQELSHFFQFDANSMPNIPERLIKPHLSADQFQNFHKCDKLHAHKIIFIDNNRPPVW